MRILIIHNIVWAHYKSSVFQALQQLTDQQPDIVLNVVQIARNERSRAALEATADSTAPAYSYTYDLLFDRFLEDTSVQERATALIRQAKRFRPDIITLTGYYDPAQILLLLWAKLRGIRIVMQNESTAIDHQRGGWKESVKRQIMSRCDGFFCFGSQSANYLIGLGVAPEKILSSKSAVDNTALWKAYQHALPERTEQQQQLDLRPHNFVFVGRLIAFKNVSALLSAFAEARSQAPNASDWGIILLGDGPEREALQHQASDLNIADSVAFLAGRPWYQVPGILALSDVLVLPSRSEPWGLVVNEAMVCGLPVIVSDKCGCVPDLMRNGQNGFVFDPNQPHELTRHLVQFMNNQVDTKSMGECAQQLIAPYAPEAVAREMLNGFSRLLPSLTK
ncbi:glycosyltransferase family 4 protein [Spirosoma fluminis]